MHPAIAQHVDGLIALCHQYHVTRLEVFGSATTDAFDPDRSDVDLLVEFDVNAPASLGGLKQYFGFKDAAEALLGREVDMVNPRYIRNRYFREGVEETRELLYAAEPRTKAPPSERAPAGHDGDDRSDRLVHAGDDAAGIRGG